MCLGQHEGTAWAVDLGLFHRTGKLGFLAQIAFDCRRANGQYLRCVVALHCIDIGLHLVGLGVSQTEGAVARRAQAVCVVQRGEQAVGVGALGVERTVGQETGAIQRNALLQTRCCVVLHELDRSTASEEGVHDVRLEGCDFGQQGLKLDSGERQAQILDDLAATLLKRFTETLDGLVAGSVLVGDGYGLLGALLGRHFAHGVGRLPVAEGTAENVRCAHGAGHDIGTGVRNDQQGASVLGDLGHGHGNARVHAAYQHVDVVALDQFVDVVGGLGRIGLIVDLDELDLAASELATLFCNLQSKAVFDGDAECGIGAGVGQHQADFDFCRRLGQAQRCGHGAGGNQGNAMCFHERSPRLWL